MYRNSFVLQDLCGARGDRWLFEGLTLRLDAGDALLVTGPNGAGKSTLLRILAGLLRPADGMCALQPPVEQEGADRHYLGHQNAIKPGLTAEQHIRYWAALGLADPEKTAEPAMQAFALLEMADYPARYLSAGQRRRLALARLLAAPAPLWLLDEPTTALDAASVRLFEDAVRAHRAAGGIAVIATHQPLDIPGSQQVELGELAA